MRIPWYETILHWTSTQCFLVSGIFLLLLLLSLLLPLLLLFLLLLSILLLLIVFIWLIHYTWYFVQILYSHNSHTRTRNTEMTILFNSGHPVAIPARFFDNSFLCDHIIIFTFNTNIPNIILYTFFLVGLTYGSISVSRVCWKWLNRSNQEANNWYKN